jgi:N-acetyl-gamma-glutamyl-phosphate reductase
MEKKIKVGVAGAAGYTGGELIRLLLVHPQVEISFLHSKSQAGRPVYNVHTDLAGETEMVFTDRLDPEFLDEHELPDEVKIIDLSQDFRLGKYARHNDREFVYGLPELGQEKIAKADNIANPGCFATCITLALLPLAKERMILSEVHISAITGSTGAGQSSNPATHFSWRSNNLSVYKPFQHQHIPEICQALKNLQPGFDCGLNFIPYRGNFTRGILASAYLELSEQPEKIIQLYRDYYAPHPFVHVSEQNIDLKQVVNTNKCLLHLEKQGNKLLLVSVIDNLLKGASGQAVQNMNLLFGLEETAGLKVKAMAF